ncbi:MAG: hypothetical protein IJX99_00250 [Clostridia bacterium]|nr:hypothetical protein [Clostridia bacterium]
MITNYLTSKNLFENKNYKNILLNGGGVVNEITPEGNIQVYFYAPYITKEEMETFNNGTPRVYHYERKGMSSLLFTGIFRVECSINPSYYTDNRYELLKGKDEIEISCFLCDIAKHEMVGAKILTLSGAKLEKVKMGLELNSKHTKSEYDYWISTVLYANDYKTNIKLATNIGLCTVPTDKSILLV